MKTNEIIQGNCLEVLQTLEENSIDAIITDPPYELSFMSKKWDSTGIAFNIGVWERCLKVLKPGGHMLVFGGSRTFHRITVAIEDAGFEIRDQIMWVYGSGFPKSHNISKAIDKLAATEREVVGQNPTETQMWEGWGTALKPSFEPIILTRKPISEKNIAKNVLKWHTGALNIDACRIKTYANSFLDKGRNPTGTVYHWSRSTRKETTYDGSKGRWPANFIHDGSNEVLELFPDTKPNKQSDREKVEMSEKENSWIDESTVKNHNYLGSAARFFYCAKASKSERGEGNNHPTVKPLALLRYLVRLITPPNGIVLDPFVGSGTTLIAAKQEGFRYIGIEINEEYIEIAKKRLEAEKPLCD